MDIVHEGMLIKSPPEKRLFKAKWRQRWFVLRHSGNLPDQYVLEYYTSPSRRKLRGSVDLDTCEQVDTGVTFDTPRHHKARYNHMFDIRTTKRVYYLVAATEEEMNQWVGIICKVCGLKMNGDEDYLTPPSKQPLARSSLTPEASASSLQSSRKHSGSYIPISECMSGSLKNVSLGSYRRSSPGFMWDNLPSNSYDEPRRSNDTYVVPRPPVRVNIYENTEKFDHDQADIQVIVPPLVKWETYPGGSCLEAGHISDCSNEGSNTAMYDLPAVARMPAAESLISPFELTSLNDSGFDTQRSSSPQDQCDSAPAVLATPKDDASSSPPPRPPKPRCLKPEKSRYENVNLRLLSTADPIKPSGVDNLIKETSSTSAPTEEPQYDFPKSQGEEDLNATVPIVQKGIPGMTSHSYSNAATAFVESNQEIMQNYDQKPALDTNGYLCMNGNLPRNEYTDMSNTKISTFLPTLPPPTVNRDLKPKRSHSTKSSEPRHTASLPVNSLPKKPTVKSYRKSWIGPVSTVDGSSPPPVPTRGFRKPPPLLLKSPLPESPAPDDKVASFCPVPSTIGGRKEGEIQYLDLDLDPEGPCQRSPERISTTVYKTVDFLKTKAFNEERQIREASYKKSSQ